MNIYPNAYSLQEGSKDSFYISRLVKELNNFSRNTKMIEHHLYDKILS